MNEDVVYPEPVYLNCILTPPSVDHKLWEAILAVFWGKPSVLNLNSIAEGLLFVAPQDEFNSQEEVIYAEPLV